MKKNLFQRKSIIILVFTCILSFNLSAQIRVNNAKRAGIGIGINESINPKASLEIRSNINGSIGGLLLPIVANVSDITSPPPGLIVYQSSSQEVCYYNTAWVCLSSPGGGGGGQVISRDGTTLNLSNNGGSLPNSLVPETGTTGYVLTKTATGYEWQVSTGGNTDLSLSTGASPVSLNSSSGSDVTITAGNNITLSSTSSNVTINATEVDGSVTNEIQSLSQSATPGKNISISSSNTLSNVLVPNNGTSGQVLTKTSVGYDWQDAPSINDLDGVIGNEVLDAFVNGGLVRTGLGTAASPYKLGLPDALTGQVMKFNGTGWFPANDNGITTEIDGVIGNEVLDAATNGGLSRSGTGTNVDPYKLGLVSGTNGQVMKHNGTAWVPGTDNGITSEVDGSITNEGGLTVTTGTSTTSVINSNTSGSTPVTVTAGTGLAISETGNTITLSNTGLLSEIDGSITNEIQSLAQSASPGKDISISSGNTITNALVPNNGTTGQVLTKTATGYDWQAASVGTEVDGVIGNEVLDATVNGGLVRAGTGTAGSPYTLGLPAATTDQVMKFNGTSWVAGTDNGITSEVDGSITNEGGLTVSIGTSTTSVINSNTSGSTPVTVTAGTGLAITETGNTITLSNTGLLSEVDGSITNEIQSLSQSASPGKDISISSGNTITNALVPNNGTTGQVLTKTATGYDWQAATAGPEVDGVIGNEVLDATVNGGLVRTGTGTAGSPYTLGLPAATNGQVMKYNGTSWVAGTDNGITTEVDGLTTNEGVLGVAAGLATTSVITSNTSGAVGVTLEAGPNITLSETASANGGNILITGSPTNLGVIGNTSPITLNSSTGTDVTFTAGTNVSLTGTTSNITINATEADGLTNNEGTLGVATGTATTSIITSNTSGAVGVTLQAGTNVSLTETASANGGIITINSTGGGATDLTVTGVVSPLTLNSSTGTDVTVTSSGIINLTATSNSINIGATEIDASITNEGSLSVGAGASNTSVITSNTIGSPTVTVFAGSGLSIAETTNSITLTNTGVLTEVDGSITNEGILGVAAGTTTSSVITSNTSTSPSITLNAIFPGLQINENTSTNNITIQNQAPTAQLSQDDITSDTPVSHSTTNAYTKIAIPAFTANLITTTTTNEISIPTGFPGAYYKANYSFCVSSGSTENYDVAIFKTTSAGVQSELKFTRSKLALSTGVLECFSKDAIISLNPGEKIDLRMKKVTTTATTSTIHSPVLNLMYMYIGL